MTKCVLTKHEFYGYAPDALAILNLKQYSLEAMKNVVAKLLDSAGVEKAGLRVTPDPELFSLVDRGDKSTWVRTNQTLNKESDLMKYLRNSVELPSHRMVRPTMMNPQSSRSHMIIEFQFSDEDGDNKLAKLFIADFAGVESEPECLNSSVVRIYQNLKIKDNEPIFYNSTANANSMETNQYGGATDKIPPDLATYLHQMNDRNVEVLQKLKGMRTIKIRIPDNVVSNESIGPFDQGKFISVVNFLDDKDNQLNIEFQNTIKSGYATSLEESIVKSVLATAGCWKEDRMAAHKHVPTATSYYTVDPQTKKSDPFPFTMLDLLFKVIYTLYDESESLLYLEDNWIASSKRVGNTQKDLRDKFNQSAGAKGKRELTWDKGGLEASRDRVADVLSHMNNPVNEANKAVATQLLAKLEFLYTADHSNDSMLLYLKKGLQLAIAGTRLVKSGEVAELKKYFQDACITVRSFITEFDGFYEATNMSVNHAKAMCMFRAAEGVVINGSLQQVRNSFARTYGRGKAGEGLRQYRTQCSTLNNIYYGNDDTYNLPLTPNTEKLFPVAEFVSSIINPLDTNKQPNTVILGVFNNTWSRENPSILEYTPCHALIQEFKRMSDDKFKPRVLQQVTQEKRAELTSTEVNPAVLKTFKEMIINAKEGKIKYLISNDSDGGEGTQSTQALQNIKRERAAATAMVVSYENVLQLLTASNFGLHSLLQVILRKSNENANTSLGTLEFLDQACKRFTTNQTFGVFEGYGVLADLKDAPKPVTRVTSNTLL